MHLTAYFPHYHNTKLLGKSFAKQKTTYESHIVSRCKSICVKNICFAELAKSLAMLLFEHITKENREVSVALCQAELAQTTQCLALKNAPQHSMFPIHLSAAPNGAAILLMPWECQTKGSCSVGIGCRWTT